MLSKYWKNTVMTSAVDFYCLACESLLRSTNDVESHIEKPVHKKKLESTPYYDKYQQELIREVSCGYFCEACNLLYATDLEVDLHVVEATHTANLSSQLLKRSGNTILAYNEISINEKAWAGFIGTTCVLCKAKVADENVHKNKQEHILNLIQSKLEFCTGKAIYRQLNNNLQCLTCNELVQVSAKSTHSDLAEHKKQYNNCRVSDNNSNIDTDQARSNVQEHEKKMSNIDETVLENYEHDTDADYIRDARILEAVDDFTKDGIKINFETRSVSCRKCSENVTFNYESIKGHIEEHKKKSNKPDSERVSKLDFNKKDSDKGKSLTKQMTGMNKSGNTSAQTEELTKFARKHELIFKNDNYYCSICSVDLRANMKGLRDHVDTSGHKNRASRKSKAPQRPSRSYATRVPLKEFMKVATTVENIFCNDVVINDKYCIDINSFSLFTSLNSRLICQLCGVVVPIEEVELHKDFRHSEKMDNILVITSLTDEFVRQIRIGVYHCGFCNQVLESQELDDHLDSTSHERNRAMAKSRLEGHLPAIMEKRREQAAQVMFMKMLSRMNRF